MQVRYLTTIADVWNLGFVPAAVLPEQFYGPPQGNGCPPSELALRRAVLDDALECFLNQFVKSGRRTQRLARDAEAWLLDDDYRWPFSFRNICHALGIEPEYVRRELKRWQPSSLIDGSTRQRRMGPRRRATPAA